LFVKYMRTCKLPLCGNNLITF